MAAEIKLAMARMITSGRSRIQVVLRRGDPVSRGQRVMARRNNKQLLGEERNYLKTYLEMSRVSWTTSRRPEKMQKIKNLNNKHFCKVRVSVVSEGLLEFTDTFVDWDPLLVRTPLSTK